MQYTTKKGSMNMNNFEFGEKMKKRTKSFAVQIVKFYKKLPKNRRSARARATGVAVGNICGGQL
jgi:hypothetical protein